MKALCDLSIKMNQIPRFIEYDGWEFLLLSFIYGIGVKSNFQVISNLSYFQISSTGLSYITSIY